MPGRPKHDEREPCSRHPGRRADALESEWNLRGRGRDFVHVLRRGVVLSPGARGHRTSGSVRLARRVTSIRRHSRRLACRVTSSGGTADGSGGVGGAWGVGGDARLAPLPASRLDPPPVEVVAERLAALRRRVESAGRDPEHVRIVAVTKGFDVSAPAAAFAVGLRDVGENYRRRAVRQGHRPRRLRTSRWHMLGAIQRRKIKIARQRRRLLADGVEERGGRSLAGHAPGTQVFVQVDTTGLPGRNGCGPGEAPATCRGRPRRPA